MQKIFILTFVLGIVLVANTYYILGGILLTFVAALFLYGMRGSRAINELYFNMPTVWQSIPEALVIGSSCNFVGSATDLRGVLKFYRIMETFDKYFELKVDEVAIMDYELKYSDFIRPWNAPARTKGLAHFVKCVNMNPERLPDIEKAVLVRKKVHGVRRKQRDEVKNFFLRPAFN